MEEPSYVINSNTLAAIGGILGTLTGLIAWLLRKLLRSKDEQIEALTDAAKHNEETLSHDRDYWRDLAMRLMSERPSVRN